MYGVVIVGRAHMAWDVLNLHTSEICVLFLGAVWRGSTDI